MSFSGAVLRLYYTYILALGPLTESRTSYRVTISHPMSYIFSFRLRVYLLGNRSCIALYQNIYYVFTISRADRYNLFHLKQRTLLCTCTAIRESSGRDV